MAYIIKKVFMENFKFIKSKLEINLEKEQLVIFSGPNGFGKTTIFDAIELIFTKNLKRIGKVSSNAKKLNDHLLLNDSNKKGVIGLVLQDDIKRIIIKGEIINNNNREDLISKDIQLFYKVEGTNDAFQRIDSVEEIIEFDNFSIENYNLFHYISQDETFQYLKKTDRDRYSPFAQLLGIENENETVFKLKNLRKGSGSRKGIIDDAIDKQRDKIKNGISKIEVIDIGDKEEYKRVFEFEENDWDKIEPFQNLIKIHELEYKHNLYKQKIEELQIVLSNIEDFKLYMKNQEISKILFLDNIYEFFNSINHYIEKGKFNLERIKFDLERIKEFNLIKKFKNEINYKTLDNYNSYDNLSEILKLLDYKEIEELNLKLKDINIQKAALDERYKLADEINSIRKI